MYVAFQQNSALCYSFSNILNVDTFQHWLHKVPIIKRISMYDLNPVSNILTIFIKVSTNFRLRIKFAFITTR